MGRQLVISFLNDITNLKIVFILWYHGTWNVITGQYNWRKRKILEALFIALRKPELNKKLLAHPIHLFPMGVT